MKKTLALFKHIEYEFIGAAEKIRENDCDYARISEYIEIDFQELPIEEVINEQLKALDYSAAELGKKYMEGLESIKQRKAELLSLTVQP